jgi:hypothetical protein
LLQTLNKEKKFDAAGTIIRIANVADLRLATQVKRIEVDKKMEMVRAYDNADQLIAAYPATRWVHWSSNLWRQRRHCSVSRVCYAGRACGQADNMASQERRYWFSPHSLPAYESTAAILVPRGIKANNLLLAMEPLRRRRIDLACRNFC